MKQNKDIYDVRTDLEQSLERALAEAWAQRRRPETEDSVIVTVTPIDSLDVMIVSDLFKGLDQPARDNLVQSGLAALSEPEVERIDRWNLLTRNEAKKVYPSTLRAKSRTIEVAHDLASSRS